MCSVKPSNICERPNVEKRYNTRPFKCTYIYYLIRSRSTPFTNWTIIHPFDYIYIISYLIYSRVSRFGLAVRR